MGTKDLFVQNQYFNGSFLKKLFFLGNGYFSHKTDPYGDYLKNKMLVKNNLLLQINFGRWQIGKN